MKNIFLSLILILSVSFIALSQPTQLTYFTEHQVEHQSDYIEIGITVHSQDKILKNAVKIASAIVDKLQKIVLAYCNSHSKKKSECDDAFEASKNQIEPKYQLVRKVETFTAFIVKHEIVIKIRKLDGIGKMTDQLLQAGETLITIDSFEWKAQNQENPQKAALQAGVQDGEQTCKKMGLKLSRIISVEQVDQAEDQTEEQGQQQEGQQQEQQDQEAEVIVFKFQVECS